MGWDGREDGELDAETGFSALVGVVGRMVGRVGTMICEGSSWMLVIVFVFVVVIVVVIVVVVVEEMK